jgi:hypothetical protein
MPKSSKQFITGILLRYNGLELDCTSCTFGTRIHALHVSLQLCTFGMVLLMVCTGGSDFNKVACGDPLIVGTDPIPAAIVQRHRMDIEATSRS